MLPLEGEQVSTWAGGNGSNCSTDWRWRCWSCEEGFCRLALGHLQLKAPLPFLLALMLAFLLPVCVLVNSGIWHASIFYKHSRFVENDALSRHWLHAIQFEAGHHQAHMVLSIEAGLKSPVAEER